MPTFRRRRTARKLSESRLVQGTFGSTAIGDGKGTGTYGSRDPGGVRRVLALFGLHRDGKLAEGVIIFTKDGGGNKKLSTGGSACPT